MGIKIHGLHRGSPGYWGDGLLGAIRWCSKFKTPPLWKNGKTMQNPQQPNGNPMGIQWEPNGNPMGTQWEPIGNSLGSQCKPNGNQWEFSSLHILAMWHVLNPDASYHSEFGRMWTQRGQRGSRSGYGTNDLLATANLWNRIGLGISNARSLRFRQGWFFPRLSKVQRVEKYLRCPFFHRIARDVAPSFDKRVTFVAGDDTTSPYAWSATRKKRPQSVGVAWANLWVLRTNRVLHQQTFTKSCFFFKHKPGFTPTNFYKIMFFFFYTNRVLHQQTFTTSCFFYTNRVLHQQTFTTSCFF